MTTRNNVAQLRRSMSVGATRYLVSMAVAAALGGAALPQHALAADAVAAADGPAAPVAAPEAIEEVTVTGSRIVRNRDLDAPSPIATIGKDALENTSATGVEAILNQNPQFVPQNTQFTNQTQSNPSSTPGAATISLRGLGSNRNLVLVDGQRMQPINATLAVDTNTIPLAAIQSVEVITGGASAVYGPDAMAGVVNFVLKKNFQGLDVDIQRGETFHSDGAETRASVLMGMNGMDDRGNIMIGLDWTRRDPVYQADRDFYRNGWLDPGNPGGGFIVGPAYAPVTGSSPSQAALNGLFPTAAAGVVTPSHSDQFQRRRHAVRGRRWRPGL